MSKRNVAEDGEQCCRKRLEKGEECLRGVLGKTVEEFLGRVL